MFIYIEREIYRELRKWLNAITTNYLLAGLCSSSQRDYGGWVWEGDFYG